MSSGPSGRRSGGLRAKKKRKKKQYIRGSATKVFAKGSFQIGRRAKTTTGNIAPEPGQLAPLGIGMSPRTPQTPVGDAEERERARKTLVDAGHVVSEASIAIQVAYDRIHAGMFGDFDMREIQQSSLDG